MTKKTYVLGQNVRFMHKHGHQNLGKLNIALKKLLIEKNKNYEEYNRIFNEIHLVYLKERYPIASKKRNYNIVYREEVEKIEKQRYDIDYSPWYLEKLKILDKLDKRSRHINKYIDLLIDLMQKKKEILLQKATNS